MPGEILDTILDAVGNTPLVRLSRLAADTRTQLVAKVETMNPGGSVKDRIGLAMIEAAEQAGHIQPGATIVEPTSGNTGTGLAMVAALKGYRLVCVMPDKMSTEKIALLRAYGAEVVVCPTAVARESPHKLLQRRRSTDARDPGRVPAQTSTSIRPIRPRTRQLPAPRSGAKPMVESPISSPAWVRAARSPASAACSSGTIRTFSSSAPIRSVRSTRPASTSQPQDLQSRGHRRRLQCHRPSI